MTWMDWSGAIETNRAALKRILALLVAMSGLEPASIAPAHAGSVAGSGGAVLPRHLRNATLRLLRLAEAAARRLVIVAARDISLPPVPPRKPKTLPAYIEIPAGSVARKGRTGIVVPVGTLRRIGPDGRIVYLLPRPASAAAPPPRAARKAGPRTSFALFDPARNPYRRRPVLSASPRAARPLSPNDAVSAARLALRFAILGATLDDLPRQARRFARWRERSARPSGDRIRRISPLKSGRPRGWRKPGSRRAHEVHAVLDTTHGLALWALERRDSS